MEPTSDSPNKATATETTQSQKQAIPLFPTVCFVSEYQNIEALNNELQAFCLEQEKSKQGIDSGSIQGGYHSSRDFFEFENESVQMLKELLMADVRSYLAEYWRQESTSPLSDVSDLSMRMTGWSVILRQGGVSTPHTHPGAHLSGVYYVSTHEKSGVATDQGGDLVLVDPRIRATVAPVKGQKSNAIFQPKPGITVMFPSFLEHYVLPFKGDGVRISIAYNITFSPNALQRD